MKNSTTIIVFILCFVLLSSLRAIKIVDYFAFNGEPMALFRLCYLQNVVDLFILTESNVTHSGHIKEAFFIDQYRDILQPLVSSGKLLTFKINFPDYIYSRQIKSQENIKFQTAAWAREMYQRDIGRNLSLTAMGKQPFILLVSDADELPSISIVEGLRGKYDQLSSPLGLRMAFFYYSFQWIARGLWTGTFAINDKALQDPQVSLETMRKLPNKTLVSHAGWHCSFCMSVKHIANKLQSFAHEEYNGSAFQKEDWIRHCRKTGADLFHRTNLNKMSYKGQYGYPVVNESCRAIPGFELLELPFF